MVPSSPPWLRRSRSALVVLALVGTAAGCEASPGPGDTAGEDESDTQVDPTDSESADTGEPIGWIEAGWGEFDYTPLTNGSQFPIVRGGQGAEMFPMPLRGGEFYLPGNPTSWLDEDGPLVDVTVDIDGFNDSTGGHFKYIANYSLDWDILDDGSYQSSFIPIIVPDQINSDDLEGLPAHIELRVRPHEQPPLELSLDVVVTVQSN